LIHHWIVLLFIAFGVSLFEIYFRVPIPFVEHSIFLAVSDIVVGLLLLYAVVRNRLVTPSVIAYAGLFFCGVSLLSGMSNELTDLTFNIGNFLTNYIRLGGVVVMLFLLPSIIGRIGHDRLAHATLWMVRLHTFLICLDVVWVSPLVWSANGVEWGTSYLEFDSASGVMRPAGLFGEPSFFVVYMTISLFYILQVERNTGTRYIHPFDIVFFSSVLVVSASLSAFLLLVLFLGALCVGGFGKNKGKLFIGLGSFVLFLVIFATVFSGTNMGKNLAYIANRVTNIQPHQFLDSSARQRLLGSSLLALEVLNDSPALGVGVGGRNLNRLFDRYWQYDPNRIAPLSLTISPALVLSAVGTLGFLPFLFIHIWILSVPETRFLGLGLTAVAIMWGGVFEPVIWWHFCLAVSLKILFQRSKGKLSQSWRPNILHSPTYQF